jgi:hypothetical protein
MFSIETKPQIAFYFQGFILVGPKCLGTELSMYNSMITICTSVRLSKIQASRCNLV